VIVEGDLLHDGPVEVDLARHLARVAMHNATIDEETLTP
jgi:hypothetical protein